MRGTPSHQSSMLSIQTPEHRVPKEHPLRRIKALADGALSALSRSFATMYSPMGRPSIPPEQLLKASLLMAFYSVRSERLFCEQLDYNLLFRWFLDMGMEEESFDHSTFSANRERLLEHDVARQFFAAVVEQARRARLMSAEHFTVDGTLIEAWASLKSFRPKDAEPKNKPPPDDPGNPTVDFHGEKRSNETHQSSTDPEARLAKKSKGDKARLAYCANALMENRNGLLVDMLVETADGKAETRAALKMVERALPGNRRITLGADKAYDNHDFVWDCRQRNITPHVAQNHGRKRGPAVDGYVIRHPGYLVSQRIRKRVEEIFGWLKTVACFRKTRFKGKNRTQLAAYMVGAAYNLLRIANLEAAAA